MTDNLIRNVFHERLCGAVMIRYCDVCKLKEERLENFSII
jgi:hypothetical protein